ncbi:MAG: four helix bundle protein [Clostridia bacterium]|nr:four helix bundle protein [Clostridia bacterium]
MKDSNNPLLIKTLDFSVDVVNFYKDVLDTNQDKTLANQLLRSATSVGANVQEAIGAISKADFISKLHIALKEINETIYWLQVFDRTPLYNYHFQDLLVKAIEIKKIITASIKTAKSDS